MYRFTAKENRQLIQTANKNLKTRQWELACCSYNGSNCLLNFMKFYKHQVYCQACAVSLGKIKTEQEHFIRNYSGRYTKGHSGNPNGIQRFTINHRVRISLAIRKILL